MSHILFDIEFTQKKHREVVRWIEEKIKNNISTIIVTPNPEMLMAIQKNSLFKEALQTADIRIPDGIGVLWASKFLTLPNRFTRKKRKLWGIWQAFYSLSAIVFYPPFLETYIPERVSGADIFWNIIDMCQKLGKRPFFLGAAPGIADIVRDKVQEVYPHIQVAGVYAGIPDSEYDDEICHYIKKSQADVVFVAYGAPKQELWMSRNRQNLPQIQMIGVGGTFDFVAGKKKRAPYWMRKFGLEWLFRLCIEPWRYMRIYTATIRFIRFVYNTKLNK